MSWNAFTKTARPAEAALNEFSCVNKRNSDSSTWIYKLLVQNKISKGNSFNKTTTKSETSLKRAVFLNVAILALATLYEQKRILSKKIVAH